MPGLTEHLRLLADENRLRLLHLLTEEPLTVAEMQEILGLSQSSVSGHLARLKRAGYLHDLAEGSAHRYRLREDLGTDQERCWKAVRGLAAEGAVYLADRDKLRDLRTRRCTSWVERVAGTLHRAYAPGRSWEAMCHAVLTLARFGRAVDVGAGDGVLAELIAPRCTTLDCVEPSPAMREAGRERLADRQPQITWVDATGEHLPFPDESRDTVLFLQSLQYMADPAAALAEAVRVLAPGGTLVVATLEAHDHIEAEHYGHRHRGFAVADLLAWSSGLAECRCLQLPAEIRAPRFVPLLLTGRKAEGPTP